MASQRAEEASPGARPVAEPAVGHGSHRGESAALVAILLAIALCVTAGCGGSSARPSPSGGGARPEIASLTIAVGGQGDLGSMPLTLADRLGYFRDEGLTVEIHDEGGDAQALAALTAGSVDVLAGLYEDTIRMQAQGRQVEMIALFDVAPGLVLFVNQKHADASSIRDIANLRIGVTSAASPGDELVRSLFQANGLDPNAAQTVAIGGGAPALSELKSDQVQALVAAEPLASTIEQEGDGKALYDTRTPAGTANAVAGSWPAAGLSLTTAFAQQNPRTAAALARVAVRTLAWIRSHSPAEIADRLPAQVFSPDGNRDLLVKAVGADLAVYSPDGVMPADGPDDVIRMLKAADPAGGWSAVDLRKTYDNSFARAAAAKGARA